MVVVPKPFTGGGGGGGGDASLVAPRVRGVV